MWFSAVPRQNEGDATELVTNPLMISRPIRLTLNQMNEWGVSTVRPHTWLHDEGLRNSQSRRWIVRRRPNLSPCGPTLSSIA